MTSAVVVPGELSDMEVQVMHSLFKFWSRPQRSDDLDVIGHRELSVRAGMDSLVALEILGRLKARRLALRVRDGYRLSKVGVDWCHEAFAADPTGTPTGGPGA